MEDIEGVVMMAEMMDCSPVFLGRMQSILKKSNDTPKKRGRNEVHDSRPSSSFLSSPSNNRVILLT